ncbi:MAG: MFS transporter, partial [Actinobacteria bacterium]|nr:MFS transporter [Actinomycetota bacterium]
DFLKSYTKLPRNVYILFIANVINAAGSFVYPFLAMFLTIKLGYSEYIAGIVLTGVIAAEGLGKLIGGKLADLIGRKIVIIVLSLVSALIYIIIVFLDESFVIPVLIVLAGFIKSGAMPAINALTIDVTTKKNRNDAFSLLYLGQNLGYAVGPLTAGFLFINYIYLIFLIDAITTILAIIPIIFFIREALYKKTGLYLTKDAVSINEKPETGSVLKILSKKPVLYGFALISIILSFVYAQSTFSLPLYMEKIFSESGPKYYGILMTVNAVVVILLTMVLISVMKKLNPIINISVAGILFAAGFGMLYFADMYFLFIISTVIWTFGEIINSVSSNVLIAEYSPITHRGRFNAIIYFISGIGFAAGPLLAGIFINYAGIKNVWFFMFILSIIASVLMGFLYYYERKKNISAAGKK